MNGDDRLDFLDGRLPPPFECQVVVVAPDQAREHDAAEWRDAIVVVERGQIELEWAHGGRRRFEHGDVLYLRGLRLRRLRNPGRVPAVLVGVSRGPQGDEIVEQ